MPNQLDYLFLYILYVHGRPDGGAKAKRTICSADLGYMQRQIFTVSVKYTGVSKKTRWKFNRLSCIINFTRQFNFYVGRKNCYLDTFLNRNDEKWPLATYSSNKLIVGRNHILPPLLGIQKHRESAASCFVKLLITNVLCSCSSYSVVSLRRRLTSWAHFRYYELIWELFMFRFPCNSQRWKNNVISTGIFIWRIYISHR